MRRGHAFASSTKLTKKLWAPFDDSTTLVGLLNRLTKEELYTMSSSLRLKGISTLNKQELSSRLAEQFPARLPQIFNLFDEPRYQIFKQMMKHGGRANFPIDYDQLLYFRKRGLIFSGTIDGERILLTPPVVLDVFREIEGESYRAKVRLNSELIQFTRGLLFYYGTLSFAEYQDMISNHYHESYRMSELVDLLLEASMCDQSFVFDREGISEFRVVDSRMVKEEHRARPDLPFYPFTKAQIMRVGEYNFIDRNFSYRSFVRCLLENYDIDQEEAEWIVEDCVEEIQIGQSLQEIMDELQVQLEIPNIEMLDKIVAQLVELMNNTKQWVLKGHAPREILQIGRVTSNPKLGRNAVCSCGSGKKYKKCCGNA